MVEMLASLVIFSILAVMAVPMAQTYRDRQTEVILKDRLTRIRAALRSYAATELATQTWDAGTGKVVALALPCASAVGGDVDGDGAAGEDAAGDVDMDGFSDDDFDGNLDEDGAPNFPPSLEALVERGYLGSSGLTDDGGKGISADRQFPRDPTNLDPTVSNTKTWTPLYVTRKLRFRCPNDKSTDALREVAVTGIYDVRSGSAGTSLSGVRYSDF